MRVYFLESVFGSTLNEHHVLHACNSLCHNNIFFIGQIRKSPAKPDLHTVPNTDLQYLFLLLNKRKVQAQLFGIEKYGPIR